MPRTSERALALETVDEANESVIGIYDESTVIL